MESKKALVLGLGTSGYASALYLAERGWSVRVMDTRREPSLLARLKEHPEISFTAVRSILLRSKARRLS